MIQPTKWSMPLGSGADVQELPNDDLKFASFSKIFPQITQVPLSAGGVAPRRIDFNSLFKLLADNIYFYQNGGVFEYSDTADYERGALVRYNDNIYLCIQDNSALNVHNPENMDYWLRVALNNELADYLPLVGGNVTGNLTVQNKNVVRSVNDIEANANGNVFMPFAPDYTSAIGGITFPYTAPRNGIISLIVTTPGGNAYFNISVDDVQVISFDTLNVSDFAAYSFIIPIKKGSVAKLIGSGGQFTFDTKQFIPYGE